MPTPMSYNDDTQEPESTRPRRRKRTSGGSDNTAVRPYLIAAAVCAVAGLVFAGVSTADFIEHLDRQVHSIHCSFIPGAGAELGDNGCRTVMMSPYSSMFRSSMWGGLPIAVLAMATFAYLIMRSLSFMFAETVTKKETLFLIAAWVLPALTSGIYGFIAATKIEALCKLCVGIYISSAAGLVAAVLAHRSADDDGEPPPWGRYARYFGEGVLYVAVMALFYVLFAPTSPKADTGCGTLVKKEDPGGVFIPVTNAGTPALAVLDPLCPACKGFDERIHVSGLDRELALQMVLFPLDSTCNWMVKESLHPGACAVSEAMLCDPNGALAVLDYAFLHQERLRTTAKTDEAKVRAELEQKFPKVKGCMGSAKVKNQVNKSLRFAVANALPVLTPQLFIGDKRVCDEDTDLGLEYTVHHMLEGTPAPASRAGRR
jgi:uncharacterized membrane protein